MPCCNCDEPIWTSERVTCEGCGAQVHDYCEKADGWVRDADYDPLCAACKEPTPRAEGRG